jgi:signal peptidase I
MNKFFRFLFWTAVVIGGVIGLARATAIRWWRVPQDDAYLTSSLSPSVFAGDLILLWRLTRPGFGDLVLCPEPKKPERVVIGRIMGESRDEVEIVGPDVTVNRSRQVVETACVPVTFRERDPGTGVEAEQPCSHEVVGGVLHKRGDLVPGSVRPRDIQTPPLADGQVWLVSDNRQYPYDSREFGPVARDTCKETVFFRLTGKGGFFDTSTRNQFIR